MASILTQSSTDQPPQSPLQVLQRSTHGGRCMQMLLRQMPYDTRPTTSKDSETDNNPASLQETNLLRPPNRAHKTQILLNLTRFKTFIRPNLTYTHRSLNCPSKEVPLIPLPSIPLCRKLRQLRHELGPAQRNQPRKHDFLSRPFPSKW